MKGLAGRRGPLKPGMDFRLRLALWFLLFIPASMAVVSFVRVWLDHQPLEKGFLANWLMWTPLMWGLVFGEVIGRRISAAVGYHYTDMIGRLLELLFVMACFFLCSLAGAYFAQPNGVYLPLLGAGLFAFMGIFGFVRGMIAK